MNKENISDIVKQAKKGDSDAFAKLFELTQEKAYYTALKITKNSSDAQDMLQDSYIKAFTSLDTLKDESKFKSWFNCIVANNCRNYIVKRKPNLFSEYSNDDSDIEFEDTLENDNEDFLPHEVTDNKETKRLIMQCINNLPEDQKLCIIMYYYDEMSVKEIAQALNVSEGTVKSRLNLARKKLKAEFEKLEDEGTKLYGIPFFPLIRWVFRMDSEEETSRRIIGRHFKKSILETVKKESLNPIASKLGLKSIIGSNTVKIVTAVAVSAALISGGVLAYNHFTNENAENNNLPAIGSTSEQPVQNEDVAPAADSYYYNGDFAVCDEGKENIFFISDKGIVKSSYQNKDERVIFESKPYNLVYTDSLYFSANGSLYSFSADSPTRLFDVNSSYIYQSKNGLIGINSTKNKAFIIDIENKSEKEIKVNGTDITFDNGYLYFRNSNRNVYRISPDAPDVIETIVDYKSNYNMKLPYYIIGNEAYYSDFHSDETGTIYKSDIGKADSTPIHIGNSVTDFSITDKSIYYADYNTGLYKYDKQTEKATLIANGDFGFSCNTDNYQLWYETNDNKTYLIKQDSDHFYKTLNGCVSSAQILDNQIFYKYGGQLYHLNLNEIEGANNG